MTAVVTVPNLLLILHLLSRSCHPQLDPGPQRSSPRKQTSPNESGQCLMHQEQKLPWRANGEADLRIHVPSTLNAVSFGLQDHSKQHSTSLNQQDGAKSSSSVPHYNGKHPRSP